MSNKYAPHLLILPEDDANKERHRHSRVERMFAEDSLPNKSPAPKKNGSRSCRFS